MRGRAEAAGRERVLAGVFLQKRDQFRHRMDRDRRIDHQHVVAGADPDQRREVVFIFERRVGHERRRGRDRRGDGEDRMAVGRLLQHLHRADRHHSRRACSRPRPSSLRCPTTRWRSMRARMSGGVEAEVGTTMRMTFDGNDCANADWNAGCTETHRRRCRSRMPVCPWSFPLDLLLAGSQSPVGFNLQPGVRGYQRATHSGIILLSHHLITYLE